jgi:undecaprenyl diphosphate synthase
MWPDFRPETLLEAIDQFGSKERRFGMTSEQVRSVNFQGFDPYEQLS